LKFGRIKYILSVLLFFNFLTPYSFSQDTTNYKEPKNIDVAIFRAINNSRTYTLDRIVFITDKSIMLVGILSPLILFTVSRINKNHYDENSSVLGGLSEATATGLTFGLKIFFKRPRPYEVLKDVRRNKNDMSFTGPYSFPSGHTSTIFSYATSLTLRYPDKPLLIAGLYTYATVLALGRIYLGVHYPTDILGGMLVGAGSAILVHSLRKEIISVKNYLFNEKGREDRNSSSKYTTLLFSSLIASDVLNYLFERFDNKIMNNTRFEAGENSVQGGYSLKINYNF
jgi:undecaprenyl-diphosphatase